MLLSLMNWKSLGFFVLGFLACALFFSIASSGLEVPFSTGLIVFDEKVVAPSDYISEEDIIVLEDRVILRVSGVTLSSYADSGSMVPVLDEGANGIRVVPESESDVEVGDIVSYRMASPLDSFGHRTGLGFLVVHRVIEKGVDEDGVYFIVKGDNNLVGDGKIRFNEIEYITIGIIY